MQSIAVHDLSEDEVQVIAAFVEFLRERRRQATMTGADATLPAPTFATWPLGVQGTLSREEIYDHLCDRASRYEYSCLRSGHHFSIPRSSQAGPPRVQNFLFDRRS